MALMEKDPLKFVIEAQHSDPLTFVKLNKALNAYKQQMREIKHQMV